MSIQLDVTNFRVLKNARLHDDTKFSLVVGYNESGKSSLAAALQYVMTGAALGRKGRDTEKFISHGQERMSVRLKVGQHLFCRTAATGDSIKGIAERLGVPSEILPLLFDSKLSGDGGSRAMRVFLDSCATAMFDPVVHFVNDSKMKPIIDQARRAGKMMSKDIVTYCESMRAAQKDPPQPIMPVNPRPTDEELAGLQVDNETATTEWKQKIKDTSEVVRLGQGLAEILHYKKALETYEKLRSAASIVDPLKGKREALTRIVNVNVQSLVALVKILRDAEYDSLGGSFMALKINLDTVIDTAKKTLLDNPPPASMPVPPVLSDEATKLVAEFDPDVDITGLLNDCNAEVLSARQSEQEALMIKTEMNKLYDEAQRLRGAWDSYTDALPAWEEAKIRAQVEWERWDFASKEIQKAEIEHTNKAGDAFGQMVSDFSSFILKGRKIKISRDEGIIVGIESIEDCSESTKWRVEVAIMAAVARTMKSPLLVIDGADILDIKARELVSSFLMENVVPYFEHTIVTSTPRGKLEEEKPGNDLYTKWILKDGELTKLLSA